MKKIVCRFAVLLCAGILCSCMDSGRNNVSADITVTDSTAVDKGFETDTNPADEIPDRLIHQSYYTDLSGYKIVGYNQAGGKEQHRLYHTSDGGSTWNETETNIDTVCPQMVTGICFPNKSVGIVTFRHRSFDFNPAIVRTADGGTTWVPATNICELLSEYTKQGYMLETSAPFLKDDICYIPLTAVRHTERGDERAEITIMSEDCINWTIKT